MDTLLFIHAVSGMENKHRCLRQGAWVSLTEEPGTHEDKLFLDSPLTASNLDSAGKLQNVLAPTATRLHIRQHVAVFMGKWNLKTVYIFREVFREPWYPLPLAKISTGNLTDDELTFQNFKTYGNNAHQLTVDKWQDQTLQGILKAG